MRRTTQIGKGWTGFIAAAALALLMVPAMTAHSAPGGGSGGKASADRGGKSQPAAAAAPKSDPGRGGSPSRPSGGGSAGGSRQGGGVAPPPPQRSSPPPPQRSSPPPPQRSSPPPPQHSSPPPPQRSSPPPPQRSSPPPPPRTASDRPAPKAAPQRSPQQQQPEQRSARPSPPDRGAPKAQQPAQRASQPPHQIAPPASQRSGAQRDAIGTRPSQPSIKPSGQSDTRPGIDRSRNTGSQPRGSFTIDPPPRQDSRSGSDRRSSVKSSPRPSNINDHGNGVKWIGPARSQPQQRSRPSVSDSDRKIDHALGNWKAWSDDRSRPSRADFLDEPAPLTRKVSHAPISTAVVDVGSRSSLLFKYHDSSSLFVNVSVNAPLRKHRHHGFHHDTHCFWPSHGHRHRTHVLVFNSGCDWTWAPNWHGHPWSGSHWGLHFGFGFHSHHWFFGASWSWGHHTWPAWCYPNWHSHWWGPTYVTTYVPVTTYETRYVDRYVVAPLVSLDRAWDLLAVNQIDRARDAFAALISAGIDEGPARVGYAITLALSDRLDPAVTSMRRALRVDPEAMLLLPNDARLDVPIRGALERFAILARDDRDLDAMFMVAALQYLLGEDATAFYAVDAAIRAGDDDASAHHLRSLIDDSMNRRMFSPAPGTW